MKNYKDTIKAKEGYNIRKFINKMTGEHITILCDGDFIIDDKVKMLTYQQHCEELEQNEMYNVLEIFTTRKGNKCLYTVDYEINQNYVIKVGD